MLSQASAIRPHHILIIDDEVAIRLLVRELLEEAGYRTSLATTALGIEDVKRHKPDLVVLEPMTGGGGRGWQLLQDLKADPETSCLAIIVCTGAVRRVREEGWRLAHQGVELVLKPFDVEELLCAVTGLVQRPDREGDGDRGDGGSWRDGASPEQAAAFPAPVITRFASSIESCGSYSDPADIALAGSPNGDIA